MRFSLILRALSAEVAQSLIKYSKYSPTPLSLKKLSVFADNANSKKSFEFLRLELLVRLANMMQEIHMLPDKLLKTTSGKLVVEIYERNFQDIIVFEKEDSGNETTLLKFTECLAAMVKRNNTNVDILSEGVMEMKELHGIDTSIDNQLSYFLDRYYTSRISVRLLINQHVLLFGSHLRSNDDLAGFIDTNCNVKDVILDAFNNAKFLCDHYYLKSPQLKLIFPPGKDNVEIVYVPTHLYHILFELFKNSMRALVERYPDTVSSNFIQVLLVVGKEDLSIQVTDTGGGIVRSMMPLIFNYSFTTAEYQASSRDGGQAAMAGFGYGLPLSKLYAKYLNGDLSIVSMEGHGTNAYIFLKLSPSDADEVLPVFNRASIIRHSSILDSRTDWSR